jgi:hypothetical protein
VITKFYNHQLEPIPYYDRIVWEWEFSDQARESQLIYFLQKIKLPEKVCVIVNHDFDFRQINSSQVDLVLINTSDHPTGHFDYNYFTRPYRLLTSDFNRKDYHPFHLLYSAYFAQHDSIDFGNKKQYLVSVVNRSPRLTRLYLLNKIRQNTNLQRLYIKWFKMSESNGPVPVYAHINEILGQDTDDFLRYEKNYPQFSATPESELCSSIEDFRNSYLNLVVESRLEDIGYLTEKIYKPLRTGQLFLVQGPPGTVGYLRSVGFDTYDDFIDHSYDTITDWQQRSDAVLSELDRIYAGIEDFYFAAQDRRIYNRNHLQSQKLVNQVLSNLSYQNANS